MKGLLNPEVLLARRGPIIEKFKSQGGALFTRLPDFSLKKEGVWEEYQKKKLEDLDRLYETVDLKYNAATANRCKKAYSKNIRTLARVVSLMLSGKGPEEADLGSRIADGVSTAILLNKFLASGEVFKTNVLFSKALSQVDRNLPLELLPDETCAYFVLPKGVFKINADSGVTVNPAGVYAFFSKNQLVSVREKGEEKRTLRETPLVTILLVDEKNNSLSPYSEEMFLNSLTFTFLVDDGGKIKIEESYRGFMERNEGLDKILLFCLNAMLYSKSGDPDIDVLKPKNNKKKVRKKGKDRIVIDQDICTVEVKRLNWSYTREYSVDQTFVNAHLRWQPYGPNRSKVKLITVKAHKRTYNKGVENASV